MSGRAGGFPPSGPAGAMPIRRPLPLGRAPAGHRRTARSGMALSICALAASATVAACTAAAGGGPVVPGPAPGWPSPGWPATARPGPPGSGPAVAGPQASGPLMPRPPLSRREVELRAAAAITAAAAAGLVQVTVTTMHGVRSTTLDAGGRAGETISSSEGRTRIEVAWRPAPGKQGDVQIRTIDFVTRTWSQADVAGARLPSLADVLAAQLRDDALAARPGPPRPEAQVSVAGQPGYLIGMPGGRATWISRATFLPVKSVSPGTKISYQWSGPQAWPAARRWPAIPVRFSRAP